MAVPQTKPVGKEVSEADWAVVSGRTAVMVRTLPNGVEEDRTGQGGPVVWEGRADRAGSVRGAGPRSGGARTRGGARRCGGHARVRAGSAGSLRTRPRAGGPCRVRRTGPAGRARPDTAVGVSP
ncbi:hypothetical protein GCM10022384_15170 [Streptomyces marokkonensis]|uniref:Uncharacterized protein n=1 Tax=Streptomyces marokkonensis TaxID=324855 RepID=A0ABP7PEA0_9ACTN